MGGGTWKVVLAFVGIFIAGTVFGAFFALGVGQRLMPNRQPPQPWPAIGTQVLTRYADRLDLTDEQRSKIKPIIDNADADIQSVQTKTRQSAIEQIIAIGKKAEADFTDVLTAEQKTKLAELQKDRDLFRGLGGRGKNGPGRGGAGGGFNRGGNGPGGPGSGPNPNFRNGGGRNPPSRGDTPRGPAPSDSPDSPDSNPAPAPSEAPAT